MHAPTIAELVAHPLVRQVLSEAWRDSLPMDPTQRHEEGGWIYLDTTTGELLARRAAPGAGAMLDLTMPPIINNDILVVATFHTHPNPSAEGWESGPSDDDTHSAEILGVPCIIQADDGIHTTGPDARRGGLSGGPGFPP